jgi:N-methylhydantoinase A
METVIVPLAGGVLSAYGLLAADERRDAVQTRRRRLDAVDPDEIETVCADLAGEVREQVRHPESATVTFAADLRYVGQSYELEVPLAERPDDATAKAERPDNATANAAGWFEADSLAERFHAAHERTYGYRSPEPVEMVTLRATATVERDVQHGEYAPTVESERDHREVWFDGQPHQTTVLARRSLAPNETVTGPAVLEQRESTTLVPPGWRGTVQQDGTLVLQKTGTSNGSGAQQNGGSR